MNCTFKPHMYSKIIMIFLITFVKYFAFLKNTPMGLYLLSNIFFLFNIWYYDSHLFTLLHCPAYDIEALFKVFLLQLYQKNLKIPQLLTQVPCWNSFLFTLEVKRVAAAAVFHIWYDIYSITSSKHSNSNSSKCSGSEQESISYFRV